MKISHKLSVSISDLDYTAWQEISQQLSNVPDHKTIEFSVSAVLKGYGQSEYNVPVLEISWES